MIRKVIAGTFIALFIASVVLAILVAPFAFYIVEPGFTAIHLRLGKINTIAQEPGYYIQIPGLDSVTFFDTRIQKAEIETSAMSKDLQTVDIGMVVNYRIDNALKIYQEIGSNFEKIIIDPFVQESVKAVVAKFTAEDLIQKRHEAKDRVIEELAERLASKYIALVDFNFTHLDFSPDFIHAVEEKQIAEQQAKRAHNLTEKVREEANQMRMRAEAEAYALKVKREAVTEELIRLQEIEAQLKAIERWNGVLPQVTGQNVPMVQITPRNK